MVVETFIWTAVRGWGALTPLRPGLPGLEHILLIVAVGVVVGLTLDIRRWRPTPARLTLPRDPVLLQSLVYLTREVWPSEMETSTSPTFPHLTHKGAVAARLRQTLEDLARRPEAKAEIIAEAERAAGEECRLRPAPGARTPVRIADGPGADQGARPSPSSDAPAAVGPAPVWRSCRPAGAARHRGDRTRDRFRDSPVSRFGMPLTAGCAKKGGAGCVIYCRVCGRRYRGVPYRVT